MEVVLRSGLRSMSHTENPNRDLRSPSGSAGFSLIEVLIAGLLLLGIALGVLPLFTSSMVNNTSGSESTKVANMARSRLEQLYQLPFSSPEMTITAGTENALDQYYSIYDDMWKDGIAPVDGSDPAAWTRTATVRQYAVSALDDEVLDPAEALPAGTDPSLVHLKEIEIIVQGLRQSTVLGPTKQITLQGLKYK